MDHEKIHLEPGETCRCRKRRKLFAKPLDFLLKLWYSKMLRRLAQPPSFQGHQPERRKMKTIFLSG